jgi:hypothetical protein
MSERGFPVLIIGGQRCGSTSLARLLESSPAASVTGLQTPEPRSLLTSLDTANLRDAFFSQFASVPRSVNVFVEKSTTYLEKPESLRAIKQAIPELQPIVILRNPIDRMVSNYYFSKRNGIEKLPIQEALAPHAQAREYDRESFSTSPYAYVKRSAYANLLEPWLWHFPSLQVLILEELRLNPRKALENLTALYPQLGLRNPTLPKLNSGVDLPAAVQGLAGNADVPSDAYEYVRDQVKRLERLLNRSLDIWSLTMRAP